MHITYEVTIGNLIAIFFTLAGTCGSMVVWFWKYSKRDDDLHETVGSHAVQLVKLTAMCKALIQLVQKLMIMSMNDSGKITAEELQKILALSDGL